VEFLVRIGMNWPADLPAEERARIKRLEEERRRQLMAEGTISRIWRIPGRAGSISVYETPDATALQAVLESQPFWPWMDAQVEALATHHLEAERAAKSSARAGPLDKPTGT
jgi:muconolactone D-isomerase